MSNQIELYIKEFNVIVNATVIKKDNERVKLGK